MFLFIMTDGIGTVVPTESDSDVILNTFAKLNMTLYTPLEILQIDRSLVY